MNFDVEVFDDSDSEYNSGESSVSGSDHSNAMEMSPKKDILLNEKRQV